MVYAPGTLEKDSQKQNMALQQHAGQIETANTNIAANTAAIATLNAATYVNSFKSRTGAVTPAQGDYPTSLIPGTTTNDNATAGNIGEYTSGTLAYASRVTFTSGTSANIISISLTAGDWDVAGVVNFEGTSTPSTSYTRVDLSTTSATTTSMEGNYAYGGPINSSNANITGNVPSARFSLASTTTVYLVGTTGILGGTIKGWGFIGARRAR